MAKSLIQTYMPEYRMRQIDRVRVMAPTEAAWRMVRALDTQANPISRALFALRSLPSKLFGKSDAPLIPKASRIEDFTGPDKGFHILAEEPGREVVIGSVGKFWKPNIEWAPVNSRTFRSFSTPGYGKLAWNLRVDPDSQGGAWISWDLRVSATDDRTWRFFRRYWFVIGKFSHFLRRSALSNFSRQLGGSPSEEIMRFPADELVPHPRYQKTMSVTIEAPPNEVWPWLVQMGRRRGGWYSIDLLDNGGVPSAMQIQPELQAIQVGQVFPWKPKGDEGFSVLRLEKDRALVLGTPGLLKGPHQQSDLFNDTWAFILEPIGEEATRLITRVRADYQPRREMTLLNLWIKPVHILMEKVQLIRLKRRIELFRGVSSVLLQEAPQAQFRSEVEVMVDALPEQVMKAFEQVTPREMPLARILGEIRYLPAKLRGRNPPLVSADEPFGKKLMESGSLVLARSPTEVVIASAGKYHQITDQEFVRFGSVEEFRQFNDPHYQKLFISVRAEPVGETQSKLVLQHWTWALSHESLRRFAWYWIIIRPLGNFVSWILLKAAKRRAERGV